MKVPFSFGDVRILVPCGSGELLRQRIGQGGNAALHQGSRKAEMLHLRKRVIT
ncbi:GL19871 [Drosophila persimilis]|uniref:GL19871 n=1 Tax=Drosophila persimilis TaxID=7234 RepID=B4GY89_DROPE|nr:GL19871 [Drosophila persimilis]